MRPIIVIILQLTVSYSQYNPLMDDPTDRGCLDHSDCTVLGYKFGCLLYKCIDYSAVTGCDEFLHCPSDKQQCIRTYLPGYSEGVCVPDSSLTPCDSSSGSCSCCGGWCCPDQYYQQWQSTSCVSHLQCRSWGTGQYCCPDNQCCHVMPSYDYYYDYDYYTQSLYSDYSNPSTQSLYPDYSNPSTSTTSKYKDILYHYTPYVTHKDDAVNLTDYSPVDNYNDKESVTEPSRDFIEDVFISTVSTEVLETEEDFSEPQESHPDNKNLGDDEKYSAPQATVDVEIVQSETHDEVLKESNITKTESTSTIASQTVREDLTTIKIVAIDKDNKEDITNEESISTTFYETIANENMLMNADVSHEFKDGKHDTIKAFLSNTENDDNENSSKEVEYVIEHFDDNNNSVDSNIKSEIKKEVLFENVEDTLEGSNEEVESVLEYPIVAIHSGEHQSSAAEDGLENIKLGDMVFFEDNRHEETIFWDEEDFETVSKMIESTTIEDIEEFPVDKPPVMEEEYEELFGSGNFDILEIGSSSSSGFVDGEEFVTINGSGDFDSKETEDINDEDYSSSIINKSNEIINAILGNSSLEYYEENDVNGEDDNLSEIGITEYKNFVMNISKRINLDDNIKLKTQNNSCPSIIRISNLHKIICISILFLHFLA